jgi:hypothetical protein
MQKERKRTKKNNKKFETKKKCKLFYYSLFEVTWTTILPID